MARTLDREPTFQTVKVAPTQSPPAGAVRSTDPFFRTYEALGAGPKVLNIGFFNRLFLVPKSNNWWRPLLDLSKLIQFLKAEKFKLETPETIRMSLQQGEWVTLIDFKDAYFHIPIQEQPRIYLRFHTQG